MKHIITMALLLPIAAFSAQAYDENGGDNHATASQALGNADSAQGLNLNDQASDSLLWTYPTFSYGQGYYRNYYPYFYNNYYNTCYTSYTSPCDDVHVLPYQHHGMPMMKHMDKMGHDGHMGKMDMDKMGHGHMGKMDMDKAAPVKKADDKKVDDKKADKKVVDDKKVDDKKADKKVDDEMTDKE